MFKLFNLKTAKASTGFCSIFIERFHVTLNTDSLRTITLHTAMKHAKGVVAFTIGLLFSLVTPPILAKTRVAFINPDVSGASFWGQMTELMNEISQDLDIEFEVRYAAGNRFNTHDIAKYLLGSDNKPNYLIFMYAQGVGREILDLAESQGVFSIAINSDIPHGESKSVGLPGEKYKYWLSHLLPDDTRSSYTLSQYLITESLKRGHNQANLVALFGDISSLVGEKRILGLNKAVAEEKRSILHRHVPAEWSGSDTAAKLAVLTERYKNTNIIWGGNANITVESAKYVQSLAKGKSQYVVGGFDFSSQTADAIEAGHITAIMGGHFVEGAVALVSIYDHANGMDLGPIRKKMYSELDLIDKNNVHLYRALVDRNRWKDKDFKKMTRIHNKKLSGDYVSPKEFRSFLMRTEQRR